MDSLSLPSTRSSIFHRGPLRVRRRLSGAQLEGLQLRRRVTQTRHHAVASHFHEVENHFEVPYAILSHTWTSAGEQSFQDVRSLSHE
ncbi:hypothetical protein C8T65DRAFT_603217, partial [Cerioporus squamosus]